MKITDIQKFDYENPSWIYFNHKNNVIVIELENDNWVLIHNGKSYEGAFYEIVKECEKVTGIDFTDDFTII